MKKIRYWLVVIGLVLFAGCDSGREDGASTRLIHSEFSGVGNCYVHIITKDGYKFAVAVGHNTCAIVQVVEK